jgi:hypothetical protein
MHLSHAVRIIFQFIQFLKWRFHTAWTKTVLFAKQQWNHLQHFHSIFSNFWEEKSSPLQSSFPFWNSPTHPAFYSQIYHICSFDLRNYVAEVKGSLCLINHVFVVWCIPFYYIAAQNVLDTSYAIEEICLLNKKGSKGDSILDLSEILCCTQRLYTGKSTTKPLWFSLISPGKCWDSATWLHYI